MACSHYTRQTNDSVVAVTPPSSANGRPPDVKTACPERCSKQRPVDLEGAERAARGLLVALGADLGLPGLRDTPRRMAAAYGELLAPEPFSFTSFPNEEGCDELVVVRDIPFQSLCMHHLLPFYGVAHIGYLPAERIVGLSKLARVVEFFGRSLQLQERLTTQVAECLQAQLEPKGVGVVLEAEHLCMALPGAEVSGARTVISALEGIVRDDPRTREEFLSLTVRRSGEVLTGGERGRTCSAPDDTAKRRPANATRRRGLVTVAARRTPSRLTAGADTNPTWTADRALRAARLLAEDVRQAFVTPHARGIRKRLLKAVDAWDIANDPARAAADGAKGMGGSRHSDWQQHG